MPCRLRIFLSGCRVLSLEQHDYTGFFTWEQVQAKFERLSAPYAEPALRQALVEAVAHLEMREVRELADLFARVKRSQQQ